MIGDAARTLLNLLTEPRTATVLIAGVVVAAVSCVFLARLSGRSTGAIFGLICSAGLVVAAVFVSGGRVSPHLALMPELAAECFDGSTEWAADVSGVANVVLYAPLALFLVLVLRRVRAAALTAGAAAVLLELAQSVLDLGVCEESDMIANLVGVALGTAAGAVLLRAARRGRDGAGQNRTTPADA